MGQLKVKKVCLVAMVYKVLKVHKVLLETWAHLEQKEKMVRLEVMAFLECPGMQDNQVNKDVEVHLVQLVGQDNQVLMENKVLLDNQPSSTDTLLPVTVKQLNFQSVHLV